jgi:hypothetical protein
MRHWHPINDENMSKAVCANFTAAGWRCQDNALFLAISTPNSNRFTVTGYKPDGAKEH